MPEIIKIPRSVAYVVCQMQFAPEGDPKFEFIRERIFWDLPKKDNNEVDMAYSNYKTVYTGLMVTTDTNEVIAEKLYARFQGQKPDGYSGRSLSVSDIVYIGGHFYRCEGIGFIEVNAKNYAHIISEEV